MLKYILTLLLPFVFVGCATNSGTSLSGRPLISERQYSKIIEQNADHKRVYSGFYNALDVKAVLINNQVATAQLDQATRLYLWNDDKYLQEKAKLESRMATETEFFVSFFTPERKNDDLFKKESIWRVFLDSNGRRYEAKIEKVKLPFAEIVGMYPTHNRFTTPYRIVFPVPTAEVQAAASVLTFTSPLANAQLKFNPLTAN